MAVRQGFLIILVVLTFGCGGDDPGQPEPTSNLPAELLATFGTYDITYTTSITRADGIREVLVADKIAAAIEITGSQPGVMGVDPGTTIPGIAPEDVIFGAAYVQNPVHVFIGTDSQNQDGDFGIWSSVWIGLPPGPAQLEYVGCSGSDGPFRCSPVFFQSAEVTDSVNLIYYATSVTEYADGDIDFSGFLADDHRSEAAAINGFSMLANHDILGEGVYPYLFDEGATFDFTVRNGTVEGTITGVGRALISAEPGVVTFTITFGGGKSY